VLQALFQKEEEFRAGSGSAHLTNGSGSWRLKNMRILQIRILIQMLGALPFLNFLFGVPIGNEKQSLLFVVFLILNIILSLFSQQNI
jgi:hypothetical protein